MIMYISSISLTDVYKSPTPILLFYWVHIQDMHSQGTSHSIIGIGSNVLRLFFFLPFKLSSLVVHEVQWRKGVGQEAGLFHCFLLCVKRWKNENRSCCLDIISNLILRMCQKL